MKVSFVIPFYGANIGGGAEMQCRRLAENLVMRGVEVETLTTTLLDLGSDWSKQAYPPGRSVINGVAVRRFGPRDVDTDLFVPINRRLIARERITMEEEVCFANNAINSDSLYEYIGDNWRDRVYFFIPYCFGMAINGSKVAPQKSFLIPCLHDEGYADMVITKKMFSRVIGSLFNSKAEMRLAMRKYGGLKKSEAILMGEGVDQISGADSGAFRSKHGLGDTPFILYVGRRDHTKNTHTLIEYFRRYKKLNKKSGLKLVLIGPGTIDIPREIEKDVLDLGFVSPEEKINAVAAATLLCQPSLMESFSLVIMESWRLKRPVLVHSRCEATADHVADSNGGLSFGDFPEFYEAVDMIVSSPALASDMGKRGSDYVERNYSWNVICSRFNKLLAACDMVKIN